MNTKLSVFDIANWFLAKAKESGTELKHMKLQKLVYFAYGWFYAYNDVPLFQEKIFAWRHGPVVADLYGEYKRFGGKVIIHDAAKPVFENNVKSILNEVWDAYSTLDDIPLSTITHREGSPWRVTFDKFGQSAAISPEEIRDYFKTLAKQYTSQV